MSEEKTPIKKILLDGVVTRQLAKRELLKYANEQAAFYLKQLPRKARRALARDFVQKSLREMK